MKTQTLGPAFKRAHIPLWVTVQDVDSMLHYMNYAYSVRLELAEWIARRFSLAFRAGQRDIPAIITSAADVKRMLYKMGYCETRVVELSALILDNLAGLYAKGQSRKQLH